MGSESSTDHRPIAEEYGLSVLASTLAHEIRNPLQVMRLQIDAALRGQGGPEAIRKLAVHLDRLERVVQKVQQLSHRYQLEIGSVNLQETMHSCLATLRFWMEATDIHLVENIQWEGSPLIEGDNELLEQVFLNLINNAIQAMPQGGQINLDIAETADGAQIEIRDTGRGMDHETLRLMGTPFFSTKSNGNGLGIAFCKTILALHGGSIQFESEVERGTTVTVRLPKTVKRKDQMTEAE